MAILDADLETLRRWIGTQDSRDDDTLRDCLAAADAQVCELVADQYLPFPGAGIWDPEDPDYDPDDPGTAPRQGDARYHQAVVMVAARLFHRRKSPEGTAGFSGEGAVVRIMLDDPDVRRLLDRIYDTSTIGIG